MRKSYVNAMLLKDVHKTLLCNCGKVFWKSSWR